MKLPKTMLFVLADICVPLAFVANHLLAYSSLSNIMFCILLVASFEYNGAYRKTHIYHI